ncbi:MAG TPA: glutamyl-tRNA reductase [Roseiflexaceae bacterium]
MTQLFIIGTHQRICPVTVRERLAFGAANIRPALDALRAYTDEGFIISTCNRVEVGGLVADGEAGERALIDFLADRHHVAPEELAPHLYTFAGADAVRHIFRLAAGLDSMVLGEDQIQLQLKAALAEARAAGTAGQMVERLLQSALAAGKLVRTQTGIARSHLSVVSVALDIAREALGGLARRRVVIVGAGRMAELALKHLRGDAAESVGVVNRSYDQAQMLAAAYGATVWPFEQLEQAIGAADVVVSCTASPDTVISAALVERALAGRERPPRGPAAPLLLLDLAVPRDVDPRAAALPGVRLVDVDDMRAICEVNRAARAGEVAHAEALVEGEVAKFMEWWAAQEVVPTIRALRERAETIRAAELERALAKLPDLSPREQAAIGALSAAIINKLLHQPIATLKDPEAGSQLAQAVQQLFQLATCDQ